MGLNNIFNSIWILSDVIIVKMLWTYNTGIKLPHCMSIRRLFSTGFLIWADQFTKFKVLRRLWKEHISHVYTERCSIFLVTKIYILSCNYHKPWLAICNIKNNGSATNRNSWQFQEMISTQCPVLDNVLFVQSLLLFKIFALFVIFFSFNLFANFQIYIITFKNFDDDLF